MLIGGYNHQHWYWALLVFTRKFLMAIIASSFASYGVKVQYLMAIVVVLSAFAL